MNSPRQLHYLGIARPKSIRVGLGAKLSARKALQLPTSSAAELLLQPAHKFRIQTASDEETRRSDSAAAIAVGSRAPRLKTWAALNFRVHRSAGEKPSAVNVVSQLGVPKGKRHFPRARLPAWPGFPATVRRGCGCRQVAKLRWVTA